MSLTFVAVFISTVALAAGDGTYYNDKYSADGISYETGDDYNGIWVNGYLRDPATNQASTGCSYDANSDVITTCSGTTVYLSILDMVNITAGTFNEATTSITINNCQNFELFEERTFENLTSLTFLEVQGTALNHVPDVSNTAIQTLNLAGNAILIDTNTHLGWTMPTTIVYLALMENQIYWIPPGMVSGPNLRIASFADNNLQQLQQDIFGNTSALIYFGADGNQITTISKNSIAPLATDNFLHLNLSNNDLTFIQNNAFSQLPSIKILELHGNDLSSIQSGTFSDMPNLVHLDLHGNKLATLETRSFENLPQLKEFRLHSQQTPMTSISYNAWSNIGDELLELFVSSNALTTFPHQVLEEGYYPKLHTIHADNNQITNTTEYGSEAFAASQSFLHSRKEAAFTPFTAYPNLTTLFLHENSITHVNNTDFCGMAKLEELYINANLIREAYMDVDAFQCLPALWYLNMGENLIQYVPDAVKTSTVLPALRNLHMFSNRLTFLESDAFSGVTTLENLYLYRNNILAIENGAFPPQLELLHLAGNDYRFLHEHPFSNLASLRTLYLRYNNIQYLPDAAFENCTSLRTLFLNYNNIPQIKTVHFQNCPLTGDLNLANNDIGWIEDGALSHITSTTTINLSNNQLTSVPGGGNFNDLSLTTLDLSNNRINVIKTDDFKNLQATTLSLSDNMIAKIESYGFNTISVTGLALASNPIRQLNEYSFNAVSVSNGLDMSSSSIATIPTRAFNDVSADEIFLQSSSIATIETEAFTDVSARNLRISGNSLVTLPNAIFGGTSSVSQDLDFSSNQITHMTYNFFNNVNVDEIILTSNNLTEVPLALNTTTFDGIYLGQNLITEIPSGVFDSQTALRRLDLQSNQIHTVAADAFTSLTALRSLDLNSNQIPTLSSSQFDGLTSLEYLDLNDNQMTHIYGFNAIPLKDVNLIDNVISTVSSGAFSSLSSLQSLYLGNNPLECTCELVETLDAVASAVLSGTCSQTAAASGITFASSSSQSSTYYSSSDVDATVLKCSGKSVQGTVVSASKFMISWSHPQTPYIALNGSVSVPSLNGSVTYHVTCISDSAPTLTATVPATVTTNSTTPVEATFDTNVLAGTTYECSVKMEFEGAISGKSSPVYLITTDAAVTPGTAGPNDLTLAIKYYDFSKTHTDFDDSDYVTVSNPAYVASPYGVWLSASSTPTADTFSQWFRSVSVNYEFEDSIILEADTGTKKTYWSDSFFPVDGSGFQAESQKDCNGTYHNFGFTSAVRTGFVYNGSEVITVGGGEALWLYLHQTKIVEFISSGESPVPCYVVDLSPASSSGGVIYVLEGVISNGECTNTTTSSSGISLELETGVTYHFDLLHAETRTCTSEFLLQVENTEFSQNVSADLAMSYSFDIDEDAQVGEIIGSVDLTDAFSVGGYTVNLFSGNAYRHLDIEDSSYTFTPTPETAPTYTNITDIDGNNVSFVECPLSFSFRIGEVSNPNSETFTISTSSIYITVKKELDYDESEKEYYLLTTVEDTAKTLTGTIGIRIRVIDVNDNCPVLLPSSLSLSPQPVLQQAALMTFTSTDIDSGENANIHYVVSEVIADPPVDYDDTMDLWDEVYLQYTTLTFTVVAMDNGTIPHGDTATVNITVSNTCVMDVQYGKISYMFYVDDITGELTYRVPKYWMYEFTCSDFVGLTLGFVLDTMMSASSSYDSLRTPPGRGRVNNTENVFSELAGAWVAGMADTSQYLEVDMLQPYRFTQVHIQGRSDADEWVTSFKIQYYNNGTSSWDTYSNTSGTDVFEGNSDSTTVVSHVLDPVILAQKIRINPQTWNAGNISMRLEYSGCSQAEQLFYDVSCMRCDTSYYCEGDGVQHTCGRCENTSATCDRNPAEHSFGLASECTSCPDGWLCANGTASPCPDFFYSACTNTSCPDSCTACEPGYACDDGIRTLCPAGTYSDGNMENCEPCEKGTYQDLTGQTSCKTCAPGYYSNFGKSQCDICKPDTYSTGTECVACPDSSTCPCLGTHSCFDVSLCYNTGGGSHSCLNCNEGYTGDGMSCTDIDECTVYGPCFQDRCINTSPGYQCLECPDGYVGTYEDACSSNLSRRVFEYQNLVLSPYENQTCEDVDECATDNGGCDPLMTCFNTVGSFYCGSCASGYMGTNKTGCYLDNFCVSGAHNCITEADCVYLGPAQYRCECKPGYAGTGSVCGLDSDLDGFPDVGLSCTDWGCKRDNCGSVPNSMQYDTDGDNQGDSCDEDDDNDGRSDYLDNCVSTFSSDQTDSDGDGYGDVCDNCPGDVNADQLDTDGDGSGDECDTDDDDDGVADSVDNCRTISNPGQEDNDNDNYGDACDNCYGIINNDQADTNDNLVGDVCEETDGDGDSVGDSLDNCGYMNGDQSDVDGEGLGDLCDDDIDDDGVDNPEDNCPYRSNTEQNFADGKNVGDVCETDSDGDGVVDQNDTCPYNPALSVTSFLEYFTVDLDPSLTTTAPVWVVKNNGGEVVQTASTAMPTMLIGKQTYGAIEYKGTWFTTDTSAEDYFGCVFGYVSNAKFYLVMWRRTHYNYLDLDESTYKGGITGIQIKLVQSTTGPGSTLANALWHSYDTTNQVTMLWQDPDMNSWATETAYRWYLTHRPSTGYINLKVYQGTSLLVDSGSVYDMTITGGRVGMFQFGEFPVIFSNLKVNCLEHTNQALYLDGVDDYVTLDDVTTLQMEESFTIEVWLNMDFRNPRGQDPVVCSAESDICLWIENSTLQARYFDYLLSSSMIVYEDTWYNIIFRHSIEDGTISLYVDGTQAGSVSNVPLYNVSEMASTKNLTLYLGKENNTYFKGSVDEVRFYSIALQDSDITAHIGMTSIERPVLKSYGTLHFRMEDSVTSSSLANSGRLSSPSATLNGGTFVTSYQRDSQYRLVNP